MAYIDKLSQTISCFSINLKIKIQLPMNRYYSPQSFRHYPPALTQYNLHRVISSRNLYDGLSLKSSHGQIKKIGNYYYNQKDQIGKGYSSNVYKAYTLDSKNLQTTRINQSQTYAIKVIPFTKATLSSLQLLQNQIEILKNLNHPNIIKCYDIYKSKTHCYIVTQYCPGGCLMTYMAKNQKHKQKPLHNQQKVITIVQQIIQAVKYLQTKGIIHRDIKPANILKGQNNWKLADFGFSLFSQTEVKSKYNVGTPLYMPLESLTENIYSPESDIFSVGVLLYQLLIGITPWQSNTQKQLIRKMQLLPIQLTQGRKKLSSAILQLLKKLCSNHKNKRMSKQQFSKLNLPKYLQNHSKKTQNPQTQNQIQLHNSKQQLKLNQGKITLLQSIEFKRQLKRLRQNKSMDHIQILKQHQKSETEIYAKINQQIIKKPLLGSAVFMDKDKQKARIKSQQLYPQIKNQQKTLERYKFSQKISKPLNQPYLNYNNSKRAIYSSIKNKYFDISPKILSADLYKKSRAYQGLLSRPKGDKLRLITKQNINIDKQKQQKTQSTTEQSQESSKLIFKVKSQKVILSLQNNPTVYQSPKLSSKAISNSQMQNITHVILNQIHFCRFLYYLNKNMNCILLDKNSKDKLSILIWQFIQRLIKQLVNLQQLQRVSSSTKRQKIGRIVNNAQKQSNPLLKIKGIQQYINSQKYKLVKKTIRQYQVKYQKQFQEHNKTIDPNLIKQIQKQRQSYKTQQQKLYNFQLPHQTKHLNYLQNQLKKLIKQCNFYLRITIQTLKINNQNNGFSSLVSRNKLTNQTNDKNILFNLNVDKQPSNKKTDNGFILSNIQGLKNLYKFLKMIKLLIQFQRNYEVFQRNSGIKVNIDFVKNITVQMEDYEKINELVNLM